MSSKEQKTAPPRFPANDMTVFGNGEHKLDWSNKAPGGKTADFIWSDTPEPHAERKKVIVEEFKQKVSSLNGPTWKTKYVVLFTVSLHLTFAYLLRDMAWTTWEFWLISYVIGATLTQNCFLAIHEITHNLAFKVSQKSRSKLLAMLANLPIGIPYSSKFPGYHMEHHRYQGVDGIDTDIPHPAEAWLFDNLGFAGRLFFATFQILFYAIRPMAVRDQAVDFWFALNFIVQFTFDGVVVYNFGMGPIWYLLMSAFFAGSLHPIASHFVAEHYVFLDKVETYSYYGWLNLLTFNVGYHNEHHDFPYVAWDKLPLVREVASKHYDNLPYHRSWPLVLWKFLTMDNMSSYSRVKRPDHKNLATSTLCKPK